MYSTTSHSPKYPPRRSKSAAFPLLSARVLNVGRRFSALARKISTPAYLSSTTASSTPSSLRDVSREFLRESSCGPDLASSSLETKMQTARCYKCGLTIRGVWRHGPPAACPACGFSGSRDVLESIKREQDERLRYFKMGKWGRFWYQVGKLFSNGALLVKKCMTRKGRITQAF